MTFLSWGAPVVGVWLVRFDDASTDLFFIIASLIFSLGVIPILLSASRTPSLIETERFSIKKLYRITPLGVVGTFITGILHGAFFAGVPLYVVQIGMSVTEISNINAIALAIGIFFQWPIAILSDRFDRRMVPMVSVSLAAAPAIFFAMLGELSTIQSYLAVGFISAFVLGLYSQCVAHTNDHLTSTQVVSAAGALVLTYGIGFALTPAIIGLLLSYSTTYFFWANGITAGLFALFILYRMTRRDAQDDQGGLIVVATASPYSTVFSAAEEWSDDGALQSSESEKKSDQS
ncbi:MAG: MFS transporter [Gammaproteobacteria bacterium]|nr:MFS transporter [Gammaproteobacteria bacterium]